MKAKGTADEALVEFAGRVQRIARVHQEGLRDRPNRHSRDVQYERGRYWALVTLTGRLWKMLSFPD